MLLFRAIPQGVCSLVAVVDHSPFRLITILAGQGSYADVYLVRNKSNRHYYAMKTMDKRQIVMTDKVGTAFFFSPFNVVVE